MNWDEIKGNWKTVTGQVKSKWGKLTDDDLVQINGKREELSGRLQKHYGHSKEQAEKHIDEFLKSI
ncbi:MAG: CsbD family protein [Candidatus Obscuribacterales bacterium]|nr:CsbD family protein [Candidatus Obscuribacterales bacterium]